MILSLLRKRTVVKRDSVPVTMTGVRMGERLLQIGIDDPSLVGALAAKVGLSGTAAIAVNNERDAERARGLAAKIGVLIEVQVAPWTTMQFPAEPFDLIVVQSTGGFLGSMKPEDRVACLQQAYRVLRPGGRIVVVEAATRAGLAGLLRGHTVNEHYAAAGGAEGALKAEGFRPVRTLGETEGYRFTEGLKTGNAD
jgi:ubiquinone/menaquinone biosynthesis C-methylase UbiE